MTAYIKMIEIWMICAMLYPFCVVSLYSLIQFLRVHDQDIPVPMKDEKVVWKNKSGTKIVHFLLDFGLPFIFLIFIVLFFILGLINTTSTVANNSC